MFDSSEPITLSRLMRGSLFKDEDQRRRATLLKTTLLATIAVAILNSASIALFAPQNAGGLWINGVMLALIGGLLVFMRLGYVRAVSFILTTALWLAITAGTIDHGVLNPNFSGYIIPVLIAGLLLESWVVVVFTALSVGIGLLQAGRSEFSEDARAAWISLSFIFTASGFLLFLANRAYKDVLSRAQRSGEALIRTNHALQLEINERWQAEKALGESEERYRHFLEASPAAITVSRLADGKITYINPAGARLFGADPKEIIGRLAQTLLIPEDEVLQRQRATQLAEHSKLPPVEYHCKRMDGSIITVEAGSMRLLNQGETVIVSVLTDVTERNLAEKERIKAELLRVELDKERKLVQLKDQFITMVSHEFRTPLTIINSSKDLLAAYHDRMATERRQEHLVIIGDQVQHMVGLLGDLLALSSINAGLIHFQPASADFTELCSMLIDDFCKKTPANIVLKASHPGRKVATDERLMEYILWNLLSNAVKYSSQGSEIRVTLDYEEDCVKLQVSDHGIGIPPEDVGNLFQPFYRASNADGFDGRGLGLAVVKTSAELHGGSVTCSSEVGVGTTFTVIIPAASGLLVTAT